MARRLSELKSGESGIVDYLEGEDRTLVRLAELGVTRGAPVTLKKVAPMGDPIEASVRGSALTLRGSDARRVVLMSQRQAAEYRSRASEAYACMACRRARQRPRPQGAPFKIALMGNPNAGKTTLFNALTGAREYVGNRPGVTVEQKLRRLRRNGREWQICDLPGIYSLGTFSQEERISRDFLEQERPDAVLNVVDATNLERNLYLSIQVLERGVPTVIALNMADELARNGLTIDTARLSELLCVPVVLISARTGQGIDGLFAALERAMREPPEPRCPCEKVADPIKIANARYELIARVCRACVRYKSAKQRNRTDRIDAILTHRYLGVPIFALVMALIFTLTFDTVGAWLANGAEQLVQLIIAAAGALLTRLGVSKWLIGLVCDGVLSGVGGVAAFLPQIALLFFFLSLLEDSGYLSRTAFLADRLLRRFGLSGRSVIPILMGFGCTVPAAMCARTSESDDARRMTLLLLPFASCSAKLPVYGMIVAAFFPRARALVLIGLYLFGLLCGALTGLLLRKTLYRGERAPFLMELPPYRLPAMKNTLLHVGERVSHFLERAGTVICLMSVVLWFFSRFDWTLHMSADAQSSMLGRFGTLLAPVFRPLGFGSWQAGVALLTGLVAKEAVVSAMTLLLGGGSVATLFTPASAFAFLVFVLLYVPCVAAVATMRRELGSRRLTLLMIVYQMLIAYGMAFLAYRLFLPLLT